MNKKGVLVGVCLCWLAAFLYVDNAFSEEKTLIIGVEQLEYFPHYSVDGKQYKGFGNDVLMAFATSKGYNVEFVILPLKRLLGEFLAGKVDFKYPDHPYWGADLKKDKKIVYSDPVVGFIDGVLVLPENKGKGVDGLKNLGTVLGFTPWDYMDHIKAGAINVDETKTFTSLIRKGIKGRIDGAYVNVDVGNYQLREVIKQPAALVFDETLPHLKDYYYLSSIKHPEVIREFNAFLVSHKAAVDGLKEKFKIK